MEQSQQAERNGTMATSHNNSRKLLDPPPPPSPSKGTATNTAVASAPPPPPPPHAVTNTGTTTTSPQAVNTAVAHPHASIVPRTHEQQQHSDDSKERQYEHELIPVAVEDCRKAQITLADAASPLGGPMKLQQGENWLRLERSGNNNNSKVVVSSSGEKDSKHNTAGGSSGGVIPSIAAYRDLPSEDCYLCIDVDTQFASIKDMRPRRDSDDIHPSPPPKEETSQMYLARRKRKRDMVGTFLPDDHDQEVGGQGQALEGSDVGGYDTDDENDHEDYGGVRRKRPTKYHPLEPLKRRQLKILHKGDRIVMRNTTAATSTSNHHSNHKSSHKRNAPIHLALEYRRQHQILYSPMNWDSKRVPFHHAAGAGVLAVGRNAGADLENVVPGSGGIAHLTHTPPVSFHHPQNKAVAHHPGGANNVKLIKPRPSINDSGYQQESGSASLSASTSAAVIAGTELSANKKPPIEEKFSTLPEQTRSLDDELTDERSYLTGEVLVGEQGYVSAITGDEDPDVAAMRKAKLHKQQRAVNGEKASSVEAVNKTTTTRQEDENQRKGQKSQEPHEEEGSPKQTAAVSPAAPVAATTTTAATTPATDKKTAEVRAEWSDVPSEAAVSPPKVDKKENPPKPEPKTDSSPLQNEDKQADSPGHDIDHCSSHSETTEDAGEPTQVFPMPVQLTTQQSADEKDDDSSTTLGSGGDKSATNMDMDAPTQRDPYDQPTQALILPDVARAEDALDHTSSINVEVASSNKEPLDEDVPDTAPGVHDDNDTNTGEDADNDSNNSDSDHSAPLLDDTEYAYESQTGDGRSTPVLTSRTNTKRDQDLARPDEFNSPSHGNEGFDYGSDGAEANDDGQGAPVNEQVVGGALYDSDVHRVSSGAIMTGPVGTAGRMNGASPHDSDVHRVSSGAIMTGPVGTAGRMNCASPHMEMLPPHLKQTPQQLNPVDLAKQDSEQKFSEKAPSSETASVTNVDPVTKGIKDEEIRSSSSAEKGAVVPSTKYDGDVSSKSSESSAELDRQSSSIAPKVRSASPSLKSVDGTDDPMDISGTDEKNGSKDNQSTGRQESKKKSGKTEIASVLDVETSEADKASDHLSSSTTPIVKSTDVGEENIQASSPPVNNESSEIEKIADEAGDSSHKISSDQTNDFDRANCLETSNGNSTTRESMAPVSTDTPNNGVTRSLPQEAKNISGESKNLAKASLKREPKSSSKAKKRGRSPIPTSPPPSTRKRARLTPAESMPIKSTPNDGRPRLMITGVKTGPRIQQMIEQIGGVLLDSVEEAINATYVIAGDDNSTLRRTPKLMIGLCRTSNIVHMDWLKKSARAGEILDCNDYLLVNDTAAEKKLGFSMKQTLASGERLRQRGKYLLDGWSVYVCKGVAGNKAPPEKEMRLIVEAANGVWLSSISASKLKTMDASRIILITSDPPGKTQLSAKDVKNALKLGAQRFTTSWLFHCMISQELSGLDDE